MDAAVLNADAAFAAAADRLDPASGSRLERRWIEGFGDAVYHGGSVRSNLGERF